MISCLLTLLLCAPLAAQEAKPAPAPAGAAGASEAAAAGATGEERYTVIRAGRIVTNTGADLRDGVIVIAGGKIQNVGQGIEYPKNATVIDARDRTVMPGLINPVSRYGLPPYSREGVHGDWAVADEWFPPPGVYAEALEAGYTALALVPGGGGVPGRALVIRTAGPAEQRRLVAPGYLRVTADKRTFRGALERAQKEIEKVDKAREEFDKKQEAERKAAEQQAAEQKAEAAKKGETQPATQPAATQPAFQPPPVDPAVQVLVDLIQKKSDVFALLELRSASDYVHLREVLDRFPIAHAFVAYSGGESDFAHVAEKLGAAQARVVMLPLISRVPGSVERIHLVREFTRAGCEVSLTPLGDSPREYDRVMVRVADLVREGWPRAEALKSVTLHPAKLLGLEQRFGTIEKDREADLVFFDADPLEPTAMVREVMISGEIVHRRGDRSGDQVPGNKVTKDR